MEGGPTLSIIEAASFYVETHHILSERSFYQQQTILSILSWRTQPH